MDNGLAPLIAVRTNKPSVSTSFDVRPLEPATVSSHYGIRWFEQYQPHTCRLTPMAQTFVFIDEDQQKKYSKSTLSAINAQVAKYAHQQRKSAKPHSAPSSPPSLGEDTQTTEKPAKTQHGNNNRRRSSQPQPTRRISPTTAKTLKHFENVSENHRRRKSASPPTVCGPAEKPKDTTHEKGQNGDAAPGDLADLFQDLCRITKHPPYQAFPFFLDLEERRLAHYCKCIRQPGSIWHD